jgi:glutathione S-transferase
MRMVQMVITNEAVPKLPLLAAMETPDDAIVQSIQPILVFLTEQLGEQLLFGGDRLNLADIVAGATVPLLCRLGISLASYPTLDAWHQRLAVRSAWQQTEPSEEDFARWRRYITLLMKRKQKAA